MSLRSFLVMLHDGVAAMLAWCLAYLLRFNFDIPDYWVKGMLGTLCLVLPIEIASFWIYGLYRGMWRFASLPDLKEADKGNYVEPDAGDGIPEMNGYKKVGK